MEGRKQRFELREFGMSRFYNSSPSVQAQNSRRAIEGAKHQDNALVFLHMRNGFDAAAGEIKIGDGVGSENTETIQALWRKVDMTVWIERSGGDKEDVLLFNELFEVVINGRESFAHA